MPDMLDHIVKARKALGKMHLRFRKARNSIEQFIPLVVRDDHGDPLILAEMHNQWFAHVRYCWENNYHAIIMAHFGSGKSSSLAVPLVCFALGHDQNLRVKVVTNDDSSARKRVNACKRVLESQAYRNVFTLVQRGDKWTEHELYLCRKGSAIDPTVQARGVMSTGIGSRADIIVFDDVCDQRNSTDVLQRNKVLSVVEETWLSRLEPDGHVLLIGTPWHISDAAHNLMRRSGWCSLVQKVSEDCTCIEQEVIGAAAPGYPIVANAAASNVG